MDSVSDTVRSVEKEKQTIIHHRTNKLTKNKHNIEKKRRAISSTRTVCNDERLCMCTFSIVHTHSIVVIAQSTKSTIYQYVYPLR
jgi:hypothetical protein